MTRFHRHIESRQLTREGTRYLFETLVTCVVYCGLVWGAIALNGLVSGL